MRSRLRLAAAVGVALTLAACGESGPVSPQPGPVQRDQRLVGTWRVTDGRAPGLHVTVDPATSASLQFAAGGRLKIYDGGTSYFCTWATSTRRLVLTFPKGDGARLAEYQMPDAAHVAMAIDALESSRHIAYAVTSGGLTLIGRSRMRKDGALDDLTIPAPSVVHIRYVRVN